MHASTVAVGLSAVLVLALAPAGRSEDAARPGDTPLPWNPLEKTAVGDWHVLEMVRPVRGLRVVTRTTRVEGNLATLAQDLVRPDGASATGSASVACSSSISVARYLDLSAIETATSVKLEDVRQPMSGRSFDCTKLTATIRSTKDDASGKAHVRERRLQLWISRDVKVKGIVRQLAEVTFDGGPPEVSELKLVAYGTAEKALLGEMPAPRMPELSWRPFADAAKDDWLAFRVKSGEKETLLHFKVVEADATTVTVLLDGGHGTARLSWPRDAATVEEVMGLPPKGHALLAASTTEADRKVGDRVFKTLKVSLRARREDVTRDGAKVRLTSEYTFWFAREAKLTSIVAEEMRNVTESGGRVVTDEAATGEVEGFGSGDRVLFGKRPPEPREKPPGGR